MKVLAIDGGGIRGLIPALVLAEIERRTGPPHGRDVRPDRRHLDRRHPRLRRSRRRGEDGRPLHSAEELAELYAPRARRSSTARCVKKVTSRRRPDRRELRRRGPQRRARDLPRRRPPQGRAHRRDASPPTTSRTASRSSSAPRARARDDTYDFSIAEAARATSAAPTYFEPVEVTDAAGARTYPLIDGGVYAINPAMCAYAEVVGAGADISVLAVARHRRADQAPTSSTTSRAGA